MDAQALIGVSVGLVIGAMLQALTGWLQDKRTAKLAHEQWLRERRFDAYTRLNTVVYTLAVAIRRGDSEASDIWERLNESMAGALAISDAATQQTITDVLGRTHEDLLARPDAAADIIRSCRRELSQLFTPLIVMPGR
jgi:hypothetical protein